MTTMEHVNLQSASSERRPRLAVRVLRPLIRYVETRASVRPHDFEHWNGLSDDARVCLAQADVWIEGLSREPRDPALGFRALRELRRGGSDVVELAAESAPTLQASLHTLTRFAPLLCEAVELHLEVTNGSAALELRYALTLSHVTRTYLAGGLLRAMQSWVRAPAELALCCTGPARPLPPDLQAHRAPLRVHFGAGRDAIVFPAWLLTAPLRSADPVLHAVLVRSAERLALPRAAPSIAAEVRERLATALPSTSSSALNVAELMGISRRTLTRRLQREGLSFSALLDDVRNQQALYYLEHSALTPQEIAQRLGYSGTATFCRAFSRWNGVSPLRHRRLHARAYGAS